MSSVVLVEHGSASPEVQSPRVAESSKVEVVQVQGNASESCQPVQSQVAQTQVVQSESPQVVHYSHGIRPATIKPPQMPQQPQIVASSHRAVPSSPGMASPSYPYMVQNPMAPPPYPPYIAQNPQMFHHPLLVQPQIIRYPHMTQYIYTVPHPTVSQQPHMVQQPRMAQPSQMAYNPQMIQSHQAAQALPQGTRLFSPEPSPLFTPLATPQSPATPTPQPPIEATTPAHQPDSAQQPAARPTVEFSRGPPGKRRKGPKPKPLSERKMARKTAIIRRENTYSRRKKEEVVAWMVTHRVDRLGEMVPPSTTDAENHFQIPRSTISGWKRSMLGLGPIPKSPFKEASYQLTDLTITQKRLRSIYNGISRKDSRGHGRLIRNCERSQSSLEISTTNENKGFEAIKQLLQQTQPYRVILGARSTQNAQKAYDDLQYDRSTGGVTILPLALSDLKAVKSFAEQTLDKLGKTKIDYLLLNAGMSVAAEGPGPHGSKWCEAHVVNHLSQHYLVHLLREKLVDSKSRIVFVSSGAVCRVSDPSTLDNELKAGSGVGAHTTYCNSKFTALLGAHWWRRQLADTNDVVAVSPGLIANTGLARNMGIRPDMADAKTIPEGARSVLGAFTRGDFPEDRDRIFLTSWGEWWEKKVIEKSTDKALQDRWSPSREEIEREAGISGR
ncbi:hypothetical protein F66182_4557 [Fusarium sp. NRRL 66182]|nr:hypothetical protein F66182_4557 [Fusarium sp. NRRL 66182]